VEYRELITPDIPCWYTGEPKERPGGDDAWNIRPRQIKPKGTRPTYHVDDVFLTSRYKGKMNLEEHGTEKGKEHRPKTTISLVGVALFCRGTGGTWKY
jgi:hypothetical protein